jgi:hypothetical protein
MNSKISLTKAYHTIFSFVKDCTSAGKDPSKPIADPWILPVANTNKQTIENEGLFLLLF